ncbi:MAG: nitroreductase family protein [Opitutaceae bacterium]|nr:nitroreductase family protein [Opitutaceae bacterium]
MITESSSLPTKRATPSVPIHELLAERWSPYSFSARAVTTADLGALFEAARWAASSYNEQPWTYIVAVKAEAKEYERMLSCLVPTNSVWAKAAPVLVLGVVSLRFAKDGKANPAAVHDLGLATASLVVEATSRGLSVHQMIGIIPERARVLYRIPEHSEALTAMAIGYKASADELPEGLRERDLAARQRKPASQFVFTGQWGQPFAGA